MTSSFFFLGDDPARLEAFEAKAQELAQGQDPLDVSRFDLADPLQVSQGLLELATPPLLSERRLVLWRNCQALRKPIPQVLALMQDVLSVAAPRRSALVLLVAEGELPPAKGQANGKEAAPSAYGFPSPLEALIRGAEVERFLLPSPFDASAQLQAVMAAAHAHGLRLTREQAGEVLLRLGPYSARLRPVLKSLALAAGDGPVTMTLLRHVVAPDHADVKGLFQALLRRERSQALQLARQIETGGESSVAVCRRLQQLAWEAVVLKRGAGAETSVLGEALGISSGAAYYRRKELTSVPKARVEALLEAVTALAVQQVQPLGKAVPLALQLQSLAA